MIDNYLEELDNLILAADEIIDIEILRKSIWETEFEKLGFYRYRTFFRDGSMAEFSERLIEEKGILKTTKYRFHWQNKDGGLIKRWDNAAHHPEIETFPHHLHNGFEEMVTPHPGNTGLEILLLIIKNLM